MRGLRVSCLSLSRCQAGRFTAGALVAEEADMDSERCSKRGLLMQVSAAPATTTPSRTQRIKYTAQTMHSLYSTDGLSTGC